MIIEVASNSLDSARVAQKAGADRIELFSNSVLGGTTPSYGLLKSVMAELTIPVNVLIRPRGGDFLYSEAEKQVIFEDIALCRELGVNGLVIGCLTPEGEIDQPYLKELIKACGDKEITFHRAFDCVADWKKAIDVLVDHGVKRILTSGLMNHAADGIKNLKAFVEYADDRITILAGGGIGAQNIEDIAEYSGLNEFHLSGKTIVKSQMIFRNRNLVLVDSDNLFEYDHLQSDYERISKVREKIESLK